MEKFKNEEFENCGRDEKNPIEDGVRNKIEELKSEIQQLRKKLSDPNLSSHQRMVIHLNMHLCWLKIAKHKLTLNN